MRAKLIAILLALCSLAGTVRADHLSDLREWQTEGLIVLSHWNTQDFTFDWHAEYVRKGNRFVATTKFNPLVQKDTTAGSRKLKPENETFLRENRLPISIRTDNIGKMIVDQPRLPITPESIPLSPVVWTIDAAGKLNDQAIADAFGPEAYWRDIGEKWGRVTAIRELQARFPYAPYILFAQNNESNVDKFTRYLNDTVHNPDYHNERLYSWLPPEQLQTLSLRVRDYAASGKSVTDFRRDFATRENVLFNALFEGFNASAVEWKGRILTEAYKVAAFRNDFDVASSNQYSSQFNHYDAGGGACYVSSFNLNDFTSPANWFPVYFASAVHLKAEQFNPKHVREVFVNITDGGCFTGHKNGRHEVMNAERISAWTQWLCWVSRGERRPLHIRYWEDNGNAPTQLLFSTADERQYVSDAGYPELATATIVSPVDGISAGINAILDHPVTRKFWIEGKPIQTGTHPGNEVRFLQSNKIRVYPQPGDRDDCFRLLDCDRNTPRDQWIKAPGPNARGVYDPTVQIKVWGTATELGGAYLVHLWSPCRLEGNCRVTIPGAGDFSLAVPQPNAYSVIYQGNALSLEAYAAASAKTPFDLWLEQHPELSDIDRGLVQSVWRIINAANAAQ